VNRLVLTAALDQMAMLRYTPAGIPALDIVLKHESVVQELGVDRKAALEIRARAFGAQAERLSTQALGTVFGFEGFLTNIRNGKGVVFHIQDFIQT
jgi:primosomal replication protein N